LYTLRILTAPTARAAVLVPLKAFAQAKLRLAPALPAAARVELAKNMAASVLAAAHGLPVAVVCDDVGVAEWARSRGVRVILSPGLGLNAAVGAGVDLLATEGVDRVVVVHGDLPLARDLSPLAEGEGVLLVPDRRADGTNVAVVPAGAGFRFQYGRGSFRRHCAEARRLGLALRVLRDERLGHDVDLPADLADLSAWS